MIIRVGHYIIFHHVSPIKDVNIHAKRTPTNQRTGKRREKKQQSHTINQGDGGAMDRREIARGTDPHRQTQKRRTDKKTTDRQAGRETGRMTEKENE